MDYSKTLININQDDEIVISEFMNLHPDFALFIEKRDDGLMSVDSVKVVRYIVNCYDKESPLVHSYRKRWLIKKRESALAAGLPKKEDDRFNEESDRIIFCQSDVVNRIILKYLHLMHDRLFQTYVIYNEMYLNQSAELMRYDFAQPSHAKAAKENLDTLGKDIEELEYKIFSGEETKKLKDLLYEESVNMFNDLRPERIAIRLEKGLPATDENPYGDYQKESMHFLGDE